jgi:hypothetical protein
VPVLPVLGTVATLAMLPELSGSALLVGVAMLLAGLAASQVLDRPARPG